MKKRIIFTGLSVSAAIVAPIVSVVSCSNSKSKTIMYDLLPTYTGHADQLLALGIKPDYYPYQLDQDDVFSYISHPGLYMDKQDPEFTKKFAEKLSSLLPDKSNRGPSWWNQAALEDGERGSDPAYWQARGGELVIYERYLLDDGPKALDSSTAPKHYDNPRTYFETNFRESRDPFTRVPKAVIQSLLDQPNYDSSSPEVKSLVNKLLEIARRVEGESSSSNKAVDGKPLPSGVPKSAAPVAEEDSWLYNDYNFAKSYHIYKLDNEQFTNSSLSDWEINTNGQDTSWVFDKEQANDDKLKELLFSATFTKEEEDAGLAKLARDSYHYVAPTPAATSNVQAHHPIYDQQVDLGGAPMFEGVQRDNFLYLYNTASKLQNAFTKPNESDSQIAKDGYAHLEKVFHKTDGWQAERWEKLTHALENAEKISTQLRERAAKIKTIVEQLRSTESDHKIVFGISTLAPGDGQSTIQTSSKYSFLYNELGFDQPIPDNIATIPAWTEPGEDNNQGSFFNLDDNGWWWNLGTGPAVAENASHFSGQFDLGVITANDVQFRDLKDANKDSIANMYQKFNASEGNLSGDDLDGIKVDYNLWNEGLKSPFVIHMIFDKILDQITERFINHRKAPAQLAIDVEGARDWGTYFTEDFIK